MKNIYKPMIHLLPALALLLAGCKPKQSAAVSDSGPVPELEVVFVESAPADPQAIHVARVDAKAGDELVLSGRVMGATEPFVSGRAAFILGDPEKLSACNDRPDDECPTPWDTCCATKEEKQVGTATVQVLGSDGRVVKTAIEGVHGLQKLSHVVVKGTVAEGSGPDALVVNAAAIHVVR